MNYEADKNKADQIQDDLFEDDCSSLEDLSEEVIRLCRKKALKILEYAERTEAQLIQKLEEGGFPPSAVQDAVAYVKSFHYVDDRRYAESYIRGHKETKSLFEMREALKDRGIAAETIDEAFQEADMDEAAVIRKLFLKKYASFDLSDRKTYEKAIRYFAAKGFKYHDIRSALEEITKEDL